MNPLLDSGPFAALAAAALWAASSLIYSRVRLTAWTLNFGKNVAGASLLILVWLADGNAASVSSISSSTLVLLVLSSLFGIVLGDTLYFRSLQILGPRRALMLSTTSPLFGLLIGTVFLQQFLGLLNLLGIVLTLAGVLLVIRERAAVTDAAAFHVGDSGTATLLGFAAAASTAVGGMFSHIATHDAGNGEGCTAYEATVIRVVTAATASGLILLLQGKLRETSGRVFSAGTLRSYLPAVVMGPCVGIWMSQIALQKSLLAIAITLTSTTPLFAIPLSRLAFGTPISTRAVCGALLAVLGVFLTVHEESPAPDVAVVQTISEGADAAQ